MKPETKAGLESLPAILEASSEAIASLDAEGYIRGYNNQFQLLTGISEDALQEHNIREFFRNVDDQDLFGEVTVDFQVAMLTRPDGVSTWLLIKIIPVGDARLGYKTLLVQEPEAVRRIIDRLDYIENYDMPTGLLNRRKGIVEFEQMQISGLSGGAFLLSLTDDLATSMADDCFKQISRSFLSIAEQSILCRFSETDLLYIYTAEQRPDRAVFERLVDGIQNHAATGNCRCMLGFCEWFAGTLPVNSIIDKLKAGQVSTREASLVDQLGLQGGSERRSSFVDTLFKALDNSALQFYIQPQTSANTAAVIGGELLVRWVDDDGTVIPPSQFVTFLEEGEFAYRFFKWSIDQTMQILQDINRQTGHWVPLSLNLATPHLADRELMDKLVSLVRSAQIPEGVLEVEITERILADDPDNVLANLKMLSESGIRIAIDDFGTGYSSLSYLRRFPLDRLKIDRVFVINLADNEEDRLIVNSIVSLAHVLGLEVIAEGVEENRQASILRETGCEYFQGFINGKPMPVSEFIEMASTHVHPAPSEEEDESVESLKKPRMVRWKKTFSTDVVSVDNEHRVLVDALNNFADAFYNDPDSFDVLATFDGIATEAIHHFDHEETVMYNMAYPRYKQHREKHKWLLADLAKRRAEIADDPQNARFDEILQYLKYWLMRHMVSEDTHLHRYLNKPIAQQEAV